MGGETCKVNSPRSDCATALIEMAKFHWSLLNFDYNTSVIDGFETNNCYPDIQKKLGYRFELVSGTFPQAISIGASGGTLPITLKIKNQGFASPFNERKVYVVLKNVTTNQIYPMQMATDPRRWLGPNEITITETLTLPSNLTAGNYKMYLSLPDSAPTLASRPEYAIRMANDNVWESVTGYNSLNHTLNVTAGTLGIADNSKLDMSIYPVPASNELNVELENIEAYQVSIFNSLGQKINIETSADGANKITINTNTLSSGLYFVELVKGATRDVRKVIVKH
jgi:archaellum component FlaG (FlaF/FlaG flagellin family)